MQLFAMVTPLVVLLVLVTAGGGKQLGCRDEKGQLVDWYVLYKLPQLGTGASLVSQGLGYLYFSSATIGKEWIFSRKGINEPSSFPGQTLKHIYDSQTDYSISYAFYNDMHPDGTTESVKGHTKGVVAFDAEKGFWMVHSVPGFPPPPYESYSYPDGGKALGQSLLCMTVPASDWETVVTQLKYSDPSIYYSRFFPVESNYSVKANELQYSVQSLNTKYTEVISFAKTSDFGKDLYHGLVAPHLNVEFTSETWLGPTTDAERLPSDCSSRPWVFNIQKIEIFTAAGTFPFESVKDNSKWAVSSRIEHPWVCIGDIDRVPSQTKRGGGTVCLNSTDLFGIYEHLAAMEMHAYELCNRKRTG